MNRRWLLLSVCALALSLLVAIRPSVARDSRPNVIIVMTDDQGHGDFGFQGNKVIKTPHLDAMAKRSARLKSFYVSPVCAPTRASLMTGRYNYRTRVVDTYVGRAMMDTSEVTLAEILKDAGYATGIFGKWHLGDSYPMRPMDQGFGASLIHRGGGIGQPSDPTGAEGKYTDPTLLRDGKPERFHGYCTDIYFNEARDWISKVHKEGKSFFCYIPTNAPHGPFHDVPELEYEMYKKIDLSPVARGEKNPKRLDVMRRIFAMITNVDTNIGSLFARLIDLGIARDTLVIFLNDNGPNGRRYTSGFRGQKTGVHEGGIRSPLIAHWPNRLEAGVVSKGFGAHIDLLPTVLEACGLQKPKDLRIDGRSLMPLLERRSDEWPDRMLCIQTHRGNAPVRYHHFALRTERWKLLHASGFGRHSFQGEPKFELYDLVADPLESKNLAKEAPEVLSELKRRYDDWFDDVSATRKDNYAPPRIHVGAPQENPTTLTRQDWRHEKGRPWGADSIGSWLVHVVKDGKYDFEIRRRQAGKAETLELEVAGKKVAGTIAADEDRVVLEDIALGKGDARVRVLIKSAKGTQRGPWQVHVRSK